MEEKTLKQLKDELIAQGMPVESVEAFNTKAQIMAVLNTMKAKEVVKRVDTLEEKTSPQEERQLEKAYKSKEQTMFDKLWNMPKVRFLIPCEGKEKPGVVEWRTGKNGKPYYVILSGTVHEVQLNGCKWPVPKGVFVDIPNQVAEELGASLHLTNEAGKSVSIDRIDPQTGRPMNEVML